MNLILEKTEQVRFFTNMREVLKAAAIVAQDYDWYISDIETSGAPSDFSAEGQWMCGQELEILLQQTDIQFIWAVFSAVPTGFRTSVSVAPYIEGNPDYWNGTDLMPQLEGALFEIACWDSSATILINLPEHAQCSFIAEFSDTQPLVNARRTIPQ
ncbi:hypothetical protein INH39_25770 [Massilia violaceinigra]|uniref:Uncharacterized protein n=1 Tax=Massilia violaceinigra TaxID=2045208 RepID=A0ABY4A235_9BURK|nr:hypothetical protein [Massilia violaceinigra]UOD28820.1 hypothetical protein INH39_25770 [Massilia violaceinigra]